MSRAYRIRVKENLKRVVRVHDKVSTQLEILEVLPPEQMADLLRQELRNRGFQEEGDKLVRRDKGVTITVDPKTGEVEVQSELSKKVAVEGEREARTYSDNPKLKKQLKDQLRDDLEKQVQERETELQKQATDRLETELGELRHELDQAVNRVTAEALKQKASQLGQIKEMTEDPQTGSLTIVVEV